jgi:hypothetical protein
MLTLHSNRWTTRPAALLLLTCAAIFGSAVTGTAAYGGRARVSAARSSHTRRACRSRRHRQCKSTRAIAHGHKANASEESWWTSHRQAPQLTVVRNTLTWTQIDNVDKYVVTGKLNGRVKGLWEVTGTSITPPATPGSTVQYSVRTAIYLSSWSTERSITYPSGAQPFGGGPPAEESPVVPPAPVLSVHGDTISWAAVPGAKRYKLATIMDPSTSRNTSYTVVAGTSVTPPAVPGQTVNYGLAAEAAVPGPWATEVTIAYPPETSGEGERTFSHKIIGTNDGAGWGPAAAETIVSHHITWNRVEIGGPDNPISASEQEGFHSLAIVGNVEDTTPLSQVNPGQWAASVLAQLQANPNISIAEAGNEMFLKGGTANPVAYGRMYIAAIGAMQAAGIRTPLLFNMFGDYARSNGTWSIDGEGGGWLREAVDAVPGLASAILANGLSMHPYGALNENSADDYGAQAVAAEENVARAVLGAVPPVYITEFGFDLGRCGQVDGACSQQEQAGKLKAAYEVFLADPHVAGIFCYQSHDDGTGQWGYMNNNNSTRPAFEVISSFAVEQGQ